jgi:outer membrane lipoprotein carrier protein
MLRSFITALCLGLLSNVNAKSLQDYLGHVNSLSAKFEQYVYNRATQEPNLSSGIIIVKSPNKFRLEYVKPYRQLYVADGDKLWNYDEDLEQVTVKKQKDILLNSPAMVLSNPSKLDSAYKITSQGSKNNVEWFLLKPKGADSGFDQIRLGFAGKNLFVMELYDTFGQRTQLKFSELFYNPAINSQQFNFVPPKGVDVIGDIDSAR